MGNGWRDVRYGLRMLAKNKGFAAVAILALAFGIGPNTAIFSVVWATLLAPLPYPQYERLTVVWDLFKGERNATPANDYLAFKDRSRSFSCLAFSAWQDLHLTSPTGTPEEIRGTAVTPGLHAKYLGETMTLGRDFLPEEAKEGNDRVVIITHRLWAERYHADPTILGKHIYIEGKAYTVVGVRPPGPADRGDGGQFDIPLVLNQANGYQHWGNIFGRLKPGVTLEQAQAELSVIEKGLLATRPVDYPKAGWSLSVEHLKNDWLSKSLERNLWLLLAAVGFVLLIACVNVANLLLAKGAARQKDIAIRASVGATRAQVFAQLITESLTLSILGGMLGIALGWALIKVLLRLLPGTTLPSEAVVELNLPVLLFTVAVTFVAGMLFGCAPAFRAARLDLNEILKQGSRSLSSGSRVRTQKVLVAAEFAFALTLLAGAGLALHSFWNLTRIDIGVRTDHVLTASVRPPEKKYSGSDAIAASDRRLLDKVASLPGVQKVALTTNIPLGGYNLFPFVIAGHPVPISNRPMADFELVTPGYFDVFRLRLLQGRFLTEDDRAGAARVVVVSRSFGRRFFPGQKLVGQRLLIPQLVPYGQMSAPVEYEIAGVFEDILNGAHLSDKPQPQIFASFWQSPWPYIGIALRTAIDPRVTIGSLRDTVASAMPGGALIRPQTMQAVVDSQLTPDRFGMLLFGAFAALALLLAALGIYGVMAFAVAQRTHEIGIRMALGAQPNQLLHLILSDGIRVAGFGALIGICGVYGLSRAMRSTLYGIAGFDYASFVLVLVILFAAALIACYIPGRRSSRVDPISALRQE